MRQRILKIIDAKAKSVREFSLQIGINQPTVDRYVKGRTPSCEFLQKILFTFPDISAEWLMRGVGSMYTQQPGISIVNDNRHQVNKGNGTIGDGATVVNSHDNTKDRLITLCESMLADPTVDKNKVLDILSKLV